MLGRAWDCVFRKLSEINLLVNLINLRGPLIGSGRSNIGFYLLNMFWIAIISSDWRYSLPKRNNIRFIVHIFGSNLILLIKNKKSSGKVWPNFNFGLLCNFDEMCLAIYPNFCQIESTPKYGMVTLWDNLPTKV